MIPKLILTAVLLPLMQTSIHAELPEDVALNFKIIHDSIKTSAIIQHTDNKWMGNELTIDGTLYLKTPEKVGYWQALKSLGQLAGKPQSKIWIATLNELDQEIVKIAVDYQAKPERVKELGGWYGNHQNYVPKYLLEQERGPMTDEQYLKLANNVMQQRVRRIEELKAKHMTPEYRLAWEAWLFAPTYTWHKMLIMNAIPEALMACGTENSIPVLMAFAEELNNKSFCPDRYENCLKAVYRVMIHMNTEKSLRAALRLMNIGGERDLKVDGYTLVAEAAKSKLEANRIRYIEDMSGYCEKTHFDADNVIHPNGRKYLPVVESLLRSKDLSEADRKVLVEARDKILKYAPPYPAVETKEKDSGGDTPP